MGAKKKKKTYQTQPKAQDKILTQPTKTSPKHQVRLDWIEKIFIKLVGLMNTHSLHHLHCPVLYH